MWWVRVREPKNTFIMSRRLWVFLGSVSFQWWRSCAFGFSRGCPPINSILCLLLHFSYCVFFESFCFFFLLCFLLLFLSEALEPFYRWFSCFATTTFLLQNSSRYVHFALVFSFCCACLFIGFVSDLFGQVACYCVLNVWYLLVFWGFLVFDCFWLRFVSFLDCCVWLLHFLYVGFGST